jgi:glycine dehydrogenase subunit 1
MLGEIGVDSIEELFAGIPDNLRLKRVLDLPPAMTEPELLDFFDTTARLNRTTARSFLGAGVYSHHIPVVVDALISRSEFFTAYTPYQAEIAQGTLQAIFEFQTYITQLTGMDVANASLYDGSTALVEAVLMAKRIRRRSRFLIARSVHPEYRQVIDTYMKRLGVRFDTIEFSDSGQIDMGTMESAIDSDVAGVIVQSPNFFGGIEDVGAVSELAHRHGALSIINVCEAMSFGLLAPPGSADSDEKSADVVVGEAQSLGIPMNFGGPHLGFIATRQDFVRQLPGRLVGMGHDSQGRRGFVLTLATREQHIRREKATSNICTNQSLCALLTTVYLALMGPNGLRDLAIQNVQKSAYLMNGIADNTPHEIQFRGPRFNEFVVKLVGDPVALCSRLEKSGFVPGLNLGRFYPEFGNSLLLCATEVHRKADMDALVVGMT